jgi:hypothetical protein
MPFKKYNKGEDHYPEPKAKTLKDLSMVELQMNLATLRLEEKIASYGEQMVIQIQINSIISELNQRKRQTETIRNALTLVENNLTPLFDQSHTDHLPENIQNDITDLLTLLDEQPELTDEIVPMLTQLQDKFATITLRIQLKDQITREQENMKELAEMLKHPEIPTDRKLELSTDATKSYERVKLAQHKLNRLSEIK